jgi:hypothetical protein
MLSGGLTAPVTSPAGGAGAGWLTAVPTGVGAIRLAVGVGAISGSAWRLGAGSAAGAGGRNGRRRNGRRGGRRDLARFRGLRLARRNRGGASGGFEPPIMPTICIVPYSNEQRRHADHQGTPAIGEEAPDQAGRGLLGLVLLGTARLRPRPHGRRPARRAARPR